MKLLLRGLTDNQGQGMAEYGLILALFVVAVVGAMMVLGPKITLLYSSTSDKIN